MKRWRVLLVGLAMLFIAAAAYFVGRGSRRIASPTVMTPPIGATCEVVLKSDALGTGTDWPTPQNSRDRVDGSKSSVVGTVVSISDEWLTMELVRVGVTIGGGGITTSGPLSSHQVFIPRSSIAYIRTLRPPAAPPPAAAPTRPVISPLSVLMAFGILIAGLWLLVWLRAKKKAASRGFDVIARSAPTPAPPQPLQSRPMPVE